MKLAVERVRLDRGGYDRSGRYFGGGAPLFRVTGEQEDLYVQDLVRAPNARAARQIVADKYRVKPSFPRRKAAPREAIARAKAAAVHAKMFEEETRSAQIMSGITGYSSLDPRYWRQLKREIEDVIAAYLVSADAYEEAGDMVKAEKQRKYVKKLEIYPESYERTARELETEMRR